MSRDFQVAAIGCSGPVAQYFVQGFLEQGVALKILARSPERVQSDWPDVEVIGGSMLNPGDVAAIFQGVDAGFLVTPMGLNNNPAKEIAAARAVIEGAQMAELKHLIYTSCLGVDSSQGVGILDAKHEIERLIEESGVPYSILRCGTYMEDIFDPRLRLLQKGRFLFPLNKEKRFAFTSQRDVPRFVVSELLQKGRVLGRSIDFVPGDTYTINDVERILSEVAGFSIRASRRFPVFYLFRILLPYFRLRKDRMSSVIPLLVHFDKHGYFSQHSIEYDGEFAFTGLTVHLRRLFVST